MLLLKIDSSDLNVVKAHFMWLYVILLPVENTVIGSAISVPEAIVDAQADQNMPWLPMAVAAVIGVAVVAIAVAMLRKKQEEM